MQVFQSYLSFFLSTRRFTISHEAFFYVQPRGPKSCPSGRRLNRTRRYGSLTALERKSILGPRTRVHIAGPANTQQTQVVCYDIIYYSHSPFETEVSLGAAVQRFERVERAVLGGAQLLGELNVGGPRLPAHLVVSSAEEVVVAIRGRGAAGDRDGRNEQRQTKHVRHATRTIII